MIFEFALASDLPSCFLNYGGFTAFFK